MTYENFAQNTVVLSLNVNGGLVCLLFNKK